MRYWKNTKEMITKDQSKAWNIGVNSINSISDVHLTWNMDGDEIDESLEIRMFIDEKVINMREESEITISTEELNSISVLVGSDISQIGTPETFSLNDAYPNPFNPVTSMQLSLDADGFTSVKVYNLMGQIVDVIHEGILQAGYHQVSWNAGVVPSGVYLVKVEQGDKIAIQKVMLMK